MFIGILFLFCGYLQTYKHGEMVMVMIKTYANIFTGIEKRFV